MKSSKTFLRIGLSICIVLAAAFYFAGCGSKDDDDKYLPVGTNTGTGPGTGTGTTTITGPSITQFGITWTFDQDVTFGQFANGDYWVVGPVTIIGIDPASGDDGTGRIVDGSMVNPSPTYGSTQGYDGVMRNYDPDLNDARPNGQNLSSGNPLIVQVDSSLVSTISVPDPAGDYGSWVQVAAILTVLSSPAPDGSFRPPYCGADKTIKFNKNALNDSLLPQLPTVAGAPRLEQQSGDDQNDSVERMFERPWIDHISNWVGRAHHPVDNMPPYGREISNQVGVGAMMLLLDENQIGDKTKLLIRFTQLGIDLYGVVQDGGYWPNNGGHCQGRKWPILFAGIILDDYEMKSIGDYSLDAVGYGGSGYIRFQEDEQTFHISQEDVDRWINDPNWPGPATTYHPSYTYHWDPFEQADLGRPEWGQHHASNPEGRDAELWDVPYRSINGGSYIGWVLAASVMGARDLWNHDALFDFEDRWFSIDGHTGGTNYTTEFERNMWNTYRADYRPVWVRDNPADIYSLGHLEW